MHGITDVPQPRKLGELRDMVAAATRAASRAATAWDEMGRKLHPALGEALRSRLSAGEATEFADQTAAHIGEVALAFSELERALSKLGDVVAETRERVRRKAVPDGGFQV